MNVAIGSLEGEFVQQEDIPEMNALKTFWILNSAIGDIPTTPVTILPIEVCPHSFKDGTACKAVFLGQGNSFKYSWAKKYSVKK